MFWKLLWLQQLLDSLFDEDWCCLGLPDAGESLECPVIDLV
jgi:hypothetical protein